MERFTTLLCVSVIVIATLFVSVSAQVVETVTGPFDASGGVAVDADGNVYVADFGATLSGNPWGANVYKVAADGSVDVFASGLTGASGNAFDAEGNLYQSNIAAGRISKITPDGRVSTFSAGHNGPVGVAIDKEGNVFVANCGNHTIRVVSPDGESFIFSESALLSCPNGLTIDEEGNLYTVNFGNGDLLKLSPEGFTTRLATLPGNNNGHVCYVNGYLYAVGRSASQIFRVSLDGEVEVLAGRFGMRGKQDGAALDATFSLPNGIDASPDGDTLYVNDMLSSTDVNGLNPIVVRRIILDAPTDVHDDRDMAAGIHLPPNRPNPFAAHTAIPYSIQRAGHVQLRILDAYGRTIATLVNDVKSPGAYVAQFDASALAQGIYTCRLQADGQVASRNITLVR